MKNEATLKRKKITIESAVATPSQPDPPKIELSDVHAKVMAVERQMAYQTKLLQCVFFILAVILFILLVKLIK